MVPGHVFGKHGEGYIRCCYATSMPEIEEALKRIERFLGDTANRLQLLHPAPEDTPQPGICGNHGWVFNSRQASPSQLSTSPPPSRVISKPLAISPG